MTQVSERIKALRTKMSEVGADWYYITSDDFHSSEYVADYFNVREYYTGFTGENAFLVLGMNEAYMWADGRFYIQAANELEGSGIELMKMGLEGVPNVFEFLCDNVKEGQSLYFDGRTVPASMGKKLKKKFDEIGAKINCDLDLAGDLWENRSELPSEKIWILPDEVTGESIDSKLERVRKEIEKKDCTGFFLPKLDDIMWLTNIRGNDVAYNPVALSYVFVTRDSAFIFLQSTEVSGEVEEYFAKHNVTIRNYDEIISFLGNLKKEDKILADENNINYASYHAITKNATLVNAYNCTTDFKAVKNETELANTREITILDSVVLTKFMYWLKKNVGKVEMNEVSVADKLDGMRAEIEGFVELSFPTISGYGPNAAMMHYNATEESHSDIKPEGLLLVDSGGTYMKGTTDVTRTFVMGPISDEVKLHFTKVAVGMLALADATFLYGCSGKNVDILARMPLWEIGIDYKCGTGHGVGYILNVHEGPQRISSIFSPGAREAALEAGMIVSDEPGVYIEGSHGIRTENCIECVKKEKNADGQFMGFKHLTFVPIDLEAIDKKYMSETDVKRLNEYHKDVYEKLAPYFEGEEKEWLAEVTRAI